MKKEVEKIKILIEKFLILVRSGSAQLIESEKVRVQKIKIVIKRYHRNLKKYLRDQKSDTEIFENKYPDLEKIT